ncbi:MAG: hypothetical protein IJ608_01120 [Lachnospiraceae bacterium]|nr:hypothetical protein [Lachnospiraceae bacterium]
MSRHNKDKRVNRLLPVKIMIAVVALTFLFSAGSVVFGKKADTSLESVSLGENYISELKYKQAIAEYKAELSIDPKNETAKEGLLNSYVEWADVAVDTGNITLATEILRAGFSETHSTDIMWRILELSFNGMGMSDMYEQAREGFRMFGGF